MRKMEKIKKYILLFLVIGLSIISLTAGFNFYESLFGVYTAILCCVIFETIRVGCLWSFLIFGWLKRMITVPMYIFIALICALAAISSFHASIIKKHNTEIKPLENEIARRIDIIKRAYANKIAVELKTIDEKIDLCNRKLAWNPTSHYWKNRLSQLTKQNKNIQAKCDSFLSEQPIDNKEVWLVRNAALLDIELEPLPSSIGGSTSITTAIQELWGITEMRAKKIISIIIVITVECGILLLSLLAKRNVQNINSNNHRILNILRTKYEDSEIKKFLKRCQETFTKYNRLPLSRELGKKQREMRKMIVNENGSINHIMALLENLSNGDNY